MSPTDTPKSEFLKNHFNSILPSTPSGLFLSDSIAEKQITKMKDKQNIITNQAISLINTSWIIKKHKNS